MSQSLGSWSMCRWMAWGLPICSSVISRAAMVWVRILCMRSGLMWRRLFQNGSHVPPTLPLASYLQVEAWWQAAAASNCQRLRGHAENLAPRIPVVTVGESDSLVQLVGSTPQQAGRLTTVEEMADARPATHAGTVHPHGQPPKSQGTIVERFTSFLTRQGSSGL